MLLKKGLLATTTNSSSSSSSVRAILSARFGLSRRIAAGGSCGMMRLSRPPSASVSLLSATAACAGRASRVTDVKWRPASVYPGSLAYRLNPGRHEGCSYRAFRAAWGDNVAVASRSLRAVATPAEVDTGFEQMVAGTKRKYYMLGGKGGVGKTSLAASLAVKFANSGHSTLVVSTDPAHSLSDSFAQDLTGGMPVLVEGLDSLLFAMEIDPEQARAEFRASSQKEGSSGVKDFMDSLGLGTWVEQLSELKLGELLDTPPPGLDEAIAISKVVQFMEAPEYSKFTRIVFDTAPTGHTLRLLSLPDFLDASIGKILTLKQKLASATAAIKSVFGQSNNEGDRATGKLELLKERMAMVRDIFRNKETTEFVIVTIPTVMAVNESSRLQQSLLKESVPVKRLIVNQILPPSSTDCKFCNIKRKDQQQAIEIIRNHSTLQNLQLIESPLFDLEIRGVPALRIMGNLVWQ